MSHPAATIWTQISHDLDAEGNAIIKGLLSPDECDRVRALYEKEEIFRSRVVMERHGFGRGEYKYFRYPLPDLIAELRTSIYPHLVPVANVWNTAMGVDSRYPAQHAAYIERCHQAGQDKPTPLLLKYGAGDYNCLHQDIYGELVPASSDDFVVGAEQRLHRRRVCDDGTEAAYAVAADRCAVAER